MSVVVGENMHWGGSVQYRDSNLSATLQVSDRYMDLAQAVIIRVRRLNVITKSVYNTPNIVYELKQHVNKTRTEQSLIIWKDGLTNQERCMYHLWQRTLQVSVWRCNPYSSAR